jgi:hypothetical protein
MILEPHESQELITWLIDATNEFEGGSINHLNLSLITRKIQLMDEINHGWENYGIEIEFEPINFFYNEIHALADLSTFGGISDDLLYKIRAEAEYVRLKEGFLYIAGNSHLIYSDYDFLEEVFDLSEKEYYREVVVPINVRLASMGGPDAQAYQVKSATEKAKIMKAFYKVFQLIAPNEPVKDTIYTFKELNGFLNYLTYLENHGHYKKKLLGGYSHNQIRERVVLEVKRLEHLNYLTGKLSGYIDEKRMYLYDAEVGEILVTALMAYDKSLPDGSGMAKEFKERVAQGIKGYPDFRRGYEGWIMIDKYYCQIFINGLKIVNDAQGKRGLSPAQASENKDFIASIIDSLEEIEF